MFSGFSNQVTSWMGAVKGEPHDEEVPSPTVQQNSSSGGEPQQQQQEQPLQSLPDPQNSQLLEEVPIAIEGVEDGANVQSPTKAGGMFSNVKSQMTGWLGNAAIPTMPSMPAMPAMPAMPSMPSIPGLRKGAGGATEEGIANEGLATSPDKATGGAEKLGGADIDDEDRSRYNSATEGADSAPQSGPGTPSEEKAGQVGMVTTKVTQGAKTFGSFLYSAVNKAGAKIKESVKDNTILGEFSKEQDAFIKGQQGSADAAVPPWVGHQNEEKVKEEILGLSSDRRNFVRAPPAGVDFDFNYDISYPVALATMGDDPALEKMRFELVPKIITEENFWRNYFYRVSLICQAGDLGTLGMQGDDNDAKKSTKTCETNSDDVSADASKVSAQKQSRAMSETEFVSDTFHTTNKDLEEVNAGIKKLGIDTLATQATKNEEQWEKELEAELQDFEVVADGAKPNADWEKDMDDLLGDDLK